MIEVWVAGTSTVLEPSTAASATTVFAGVLDTAALGARGPNHLRCRHVQGRRLDGY